jgi:hypothetical protein
LIFFLKKNFILIKKFQGWNLLHSGIHTKIANAVVWVAMMQLLTSLDVGAKFDSQFRELTYDIQGKKTLPVTDNGLLSVDIKGGYNFNPGSKQVCFKCLFHRLLGLDFPSGFPWIGIMLCA